MGYTHYWHYVSSKQISKEDWKILCDFAYTAIMSSVGKTTDSAGGYYSDKTIELKDIEITEKLIRFNGEGELANETFYFERKGSFDFCKTARKPYDLLVVAILYKASKMGLIKFTSDGGSDDLKAGIELAESL